MMTAEQREREALAFLDEATMHWSRAVTFKHKIARIMVNWADKQIAKATNPTVNMLRDAEVRACVEREKLRGENAELTRLLPETFYADRDLPFRITRLVAEWRGVIVANGTLEEKNAQLTREVADLRAQLAKENNNELA